MLALRDTETSSPSPAVAAHTPVLLAETLAALAPVSGGRYVDATVGGGGHAFAILDQSTPDGQLLGLDRDDSTLPVARERLRAFGGRVTLVHEAFAELTRVAMQQGWPTADGILFDLGFSSLQLAASERGLSFQRDAPLDMRLDRSAAIPTAADLLATLAEADLANLLYRFGEEPAARRIARELVARRRLGGVRTTGQLREAVFRVKGDRAGGRIDPATRTFQALRIAVNDELGQLERALPQAIRLLAPSGRLAVISFHSLEDRIVKRTLATAAAGCVCPPGLPECRCGHRPEVRLLDRKPRAPGPVEVARNPRARSARLRAAEKLGDGPGEAHCR